MSRIVDGEPTMGALDAFLDEALVQYYRRALFHVDANDGNDANDAHRRETRRTGRDSPRPDDGSGRTYPRDPSSSKGPEDPSRSDGASTRQEAPSSGSRNGGSTNSRLSGGSASLDESSSSSGLHFSLASTSASGVGLGGSAGTVPLSSTDGNGPQSTPQRPAYEVAMLLNTARPRRDLEEILAKILQAGLELDVAGPDQTMQKDRAIVFLHIPDDKLEQEAAHALANDFLKGVGTAYINDLDATALAGRCTPAERIRLLHNLLLRPRHENGVGCGSHGPGLDPHGDPAIVRLYPLHDHTFNRHWLRSWAAKWSMTDDDLTAVRNHYGEEVGFYFAFVNFYIAWLVVPAIVGVVVHWSAGPYSMAHAVFNIVWSAFFLIYWRRRERELSLLWNVSNFGSTERVRRGFVGVPTQDPVTGETTLTSSTRAMLARRVVSGMVIFAVSLVVLALVASIVVFDVVMGDLYTGPFHELLRFLPMVVFSAAIPTMNSLYLSLARSLTAWENYRTEVEHVYGLIRKLVIFSMVVSYCVFFILACVYVPYGEAISRNLSHILDVKRDFTVGPDRIGHHLSTVLITGQIISFVREVILPRLQRQGQEVIAARLATLRNIVRARRRRQTLAAAGVAPAAATSGGPEGGHDEGAAGGGGDGSGSDSDSDAPDSGSLAELAASVASPAALHPGGRRQDLRDRRRRGAVHLPRADEPRLAPLQPQAARGQRSSHTEAYIALAAEEGLLPSYTTTSDYMEMVIQFGYVTLFSVVWPLAPLAAFLNNLVEIRSDPLAVAYQCRRVHPHRAEGIGPWLDVLTFLGWLGSITGAALVVFYGHFHFSMASLSAFLDSLDNWGLWVDLIQGDLRSPGPGHVAAPIVATLADVVVVFVAEHLFLALLLLLPRIIPAVPGWVQTASRRREYRMKKALFDLHVQAHPTAAGEGMPWPAAAPGAAANVQPRRASAALDPLNRLKQLWRRGSQVAPPVPPVADGAQRAEPDGAQRAEPDGGRPAPASPDVHLAALQATVHTHLARRLLDRALASA